MKLRSIEPQFVDFIPERLEHGVLYISMRYATATHLCLCGCGKEVATPLSPTDWKLSFDGRVTLYPSVGNWNFECRSHYIISANQVKWASGMSQARIEAGRQRDRTAKASYYGNVDVPSHEPRTTEVHEVLPASEGNSLLARAARLFRKLWS